MARFTYLSGRRYRSWAAKFTLSAVTGTPLGERVTGFYGLTGDGRTAMIEMAAASGLAMVPPPSAIRA